MKSTGIVRNLDQLGRYTLPKETRKVLGIEEGTPLETYVDGDVICLKKYVPDKTCAHCGSTEEIITVEESCICRKCLDKFNRAIQ